MSTKEPWNNEIYRAMKEESTEMKRHDRGKEESKRPLTTRFLTFLVVLMFILVGFAIGFILWNNQVRNTASIAKSFHQSSASKSEQASSQVPASSSTEASTPASRVVRLLHHQAVAQKLPIPIQLQQGITQVQLRLRQVFLGRQLPA